jgi:hypothetical protein
MAEQWISAAEAHGLIASLTSSERAEHLIYGRANDGLIRARARLLVQTEQRSENTEVYSSFWYSGQRNGLQADWTAGDFYPKEIPDLFRAYGVSFELKGVLELLPVEQRAQAARHFSVIGDPAWIGAREAKLFAFSEGGFQPKGAEEAILSRARLSLISAKTILMERRDKPSPNSRPGLDRDEREWVVPDWFWKGFTDSGSSQDWTHGVFSGEGVSPSGRCVMTLTGVHFLRASLQSLVPARVAQAPDASVPAESSPRPKGGQPARAFWDEMLCDIWALIHQGDFKPERQADVERAMLIWAEKKGEKLSEPTARPKAKLLFARYRNEAENFLAD